MSKKQSNFCQNVTRRQFLNVGLALGSLTLIAPANHAFASSNNLDAYKAFISVSKMLTDESSLNKTLADNLFAAFVSYDSTFMDRVQVLDQFIKDDSVSISDLQKVLDNKQKSLADLPKLIATGWFVGVVGEGDKAVCVAYVDALMNVEVADKLRPPSYAYGVYGSWQKSPV